MTRISFNELKSTIQKAFVLAGMPEEKAAVCAEVHTISTQDGVASHGINRVERFVEYLNTGLVDPNATPSLEKSLGAMEVYDGNMGPGVLNAIFSMNRATELAKTNGLGIVGLKNTTHWMRGGHYGWMAADKGFASICWTNTESCMPAWGSKSECVGNNPFVMAVPRKEGHIVLDMAMSQYSYGRVWGSCDKGQKLPYPGGFDHDGNLTDDPCVIAETRRILPMGYWKGSGFAILLDLISVLLTGGLSSSGIDKANKGSAGSSNQVFFAIDPTHITTQELVERAMNETVAHLKAAVPVKDGGEIFYPGEQSTRTRKQNIELGIPVDDKVWNRIKELAAVQS